MWRTFYSFDIYDRRRNVKESSKSKIKNKKKKKELLEIIEILVEFSSMYLIEQIKSGANIVKIFESWAGLLDKELIF